MLSHFSLNKRSEPAYLQRQQRHAAILRARSQRNTAEEQDRVGEIIIRARSLTLRNFEKNIKQLLHITIFNSPALRAPAP